MVAFICELCYIQLKGIYLADCSPLVPQASPGGHGLIYESFLFIHILLEQILLYKMAVPNSFARTAWFFLSSNFNILP